MTPTARYQVVYWPGSIPAEKRNQGNLCDGAIFQALHHAADLKRRVERAGGKVGEVIELPPGGTYWLSVEEYLTAGTLTADQLHDIGQRGRDKKSFTKP